MRRAAIFGAQQSGNPARAANVGSDAFQVGIFSLAVRQNGVETSPFSVEQRNDIIRKELFCSIEDVEQTPVGGEPRLFDPREIAGLAKLEV